MDVASLLLPDSSLGFASSGLILLRLFTGLVFIRHGWTKLSNLRLWADAMKTPAWLCFLSAFSMWGRRDRPSGWVPHAAGSDGHSGVHALCRCSESFATAFPLSLPIPFKSLREITQAPWELGSLLAGKKPRCMW